MMLLILGRRQVVFWKTELARCDRLAATGSPRMAALSFGAGATTASTNAIVIPAKAGSCIAETAVLE
jgi:hypothetical protein